MNLTGDYSAILSKEITKVNLNSSLKSLYSSLAGSLISKLYGKTLPMSMFYFHTKFFMLCVRPTFVVIAFYPKIWLTCWFGASEILKTSLALSA